MSSGGLLNLVAQGNYNVFFTGNPSKTFFKTSFKKHTDFGMQKFRIDFEGQRLLRLTESSTFRFRVLRYADLLMDAYLVFTLPDVWSPIYHPCAETGERWAPYEFRWIRSPGLQAIEEVSITCGSVELARYSGEYLMLRANRDMSAEKLSLLRRMTGDVCEMTDPANAFGRVNGYPSAYYTQTALGAEPSIRGRTLYVPISAWFTMNANCALPLVSLQNAEVYITVRMRPIQELFQVRDIFDPISNFPYIQPDFNRPEFSLYRFLQTPPSVDLSASNYATQMSDWNADVHLLTTYCFLSEEERLVFAGRDQVYLLRDVARHDFYNVVGSQRLNVQTGGMVSSWMLRVQRNDANMRNEWSNFTNWPYEGLPSNVLVAPLTDVLSPIVGAAGVGLGPLANPSGDTTGIFISGDFNADNRKEILVSLGIVLDGNFRETLQPREVFEYVEKYVRCHGGGDMEGLYCYNFCLDTDPSVSQPSGAINMSRFRNVQLDVSTYVPSIDPINSQTQLICDLSGVPIGVMKSNWRLYEYSFNMTLYEEKLNLLSFIDGIASLAFTT